MNMREKIARAMFTGADARMFNWDNAPIWMRDRYLGMADAALSALAEPDEAMLDATMGARGVVGHGIWAAMIDAASEPTP